MQQSSMVAAKLVRDRRRRRRHGLDWGRTEDEEEEEEEEEEGAVVVMAEANSWGKSLVQAHSMHAPWWLSPCTHTSGSWMPCLCR